MLKRTVTYEDYDGVVRQEDLYFNLTEAELTMMEMSEAGGYQKRLERMIQAKDTPSLIQVIKGILDASYGQKSPDGKRFVKSKELLEEFMQTEAYSNLFMELCTDDNKALEFVVGILPKNLAQAVKDKIEEDKKAEAEAKQIEG